MKLLRLSWLVIIISLFQFTYVFPQDSYKFTTVKQLAATSVKNQGFTGTCWSFATCSLLESELLRKGVEEADLSEMFIVRNAFVEKAILYVRLHGKCNFGQGGEAHDVINIMRKYGMVPKEAYEKKRKGDTILDHSLLETEMKVYLDSIITKYGEKLPSDWIEGFEKILNKRMGKVPKTFKYKGEKYTPKTYMTDYLKINPDDFVEFTSFDHHPFYRRFFLEIPDNWSFDLYNNIPIDEITEVIDSSIYKGYTVAWGGDVSEKEFSSSRCIAIIPKTDWEHKSKAEKDRTLIVPEKELKVTQELRQESFDNYTTQDDHFMQITGIATDQNGTKYYITKNSWGVKGNMEGYVYLSEAYIKMKTISLMVDKYALPEKVKEECGIK